MISFFGDVIDGNFDVLSQKGGPAVSNMILLVLLRFLVFRRNVQQNLSQFRHAVVDSHRYLLERRMVVEVVTNIEVLLLETKRE